MKYIMTNEGPAVLISEVIAEIEKERPPDRPKGTGGITYYAENGRRNVCDHLLKVFRYKLKRIEVRATHADLRKAGNAKGGS